MRGSTANAISKVLQICDTIVRQETTDPRILSEAIAGFDNFGGLFGDLKGLIFNMLVALHFQTKGYRTTLGWKADVYDIDVLAEKSGEVWFIECKGVKSTNTVSSGDVKRHAEKRRRVAIDIYGGQRGNSFHTLLATSGNIDPGTYADGDSLRKPSDVNATLHLWDGERLMKELEKAGDKELMKALKRYY